MFIKFDIFFPRFILNYLKNNFEQIFNFILPINKITVSYAELTEHLRYLRNTKISNFEQKFELLKKIKNFTNDKI